MSVLLLSVSLLLLSVSVAVLLLLSVLLLLKAHSETKGPLFSLQHDHDRAERAATERVAAERAGIKFFVLWR